MKVAVKGHIIVDAATWQETLKELPGFLNALSDYDAYLELDDEQVHPDGSMVMLHDPTGEIEDEGPAEVDGYEGAGLYVVTIPKKYRRDPDDVDGIREVPQEQMVPYKPKKGHLKS